MKTALQHSHRPRRLATAAALALLTACAAVPLQPDLSAKAPVLTGFGESRVDITSVSPTAKAWFNAGLLQAWAFNGPEAIRMFKAALAQDPHCAMCAWGVAWQLGPNINDPQRMPVAQAERYADLALRNAAGTTPKEQALIAAIALRYGHASTARDSAPLLADTCGPGGRGERAHPLDIAYAERLRSLLPQWPDDPELLSLYAEAEMVATRTDWWSATGQPSGRIGDLTQRLEAAALSHPTHTGITHYLVHATDAPGIASRGEAAADRLGALAPASPHLVHMPSHTYLQLGRYADATRVNEQAVTADLNLFEVQKQQGFSISKDWRNHDQSFLSYAALMEGRGDVALAAAREVAGRAAEGKGLFAEYHRSHPTLVLLRLQRWDALLAEPLPKGDKGMATLLGEQAHGVALARRGRVSEAQAALARAETALAQTVVTIGKPDRFDLEFLGGLRGSVERLKAEIALALGHPADAVVLQTQAVALAKDVEQGDPPMLASGTRLVLAEMQLRAGRPAEAEATYRADLAAWPHSGWALTGLVRALQAQGHDTAALKHEAAKTWALADAELRNAR